MRIGIAIGGCACLLAGTLAAHSATGISRAVYVERIAVAPDGTRARTVEPADELRSGDKVILLVETRDSRTGRPLTLSSQVPAPLAFQQSSSEEVEVSVDGGRNWGRLERLRVPDGDSMRRASPEDVTHLRWRFRGGRPVRLTYSAIVR
ncbi:hypothetical protein [Pelagerythrobacter marensis]|uniref:Uncharacterized protein n=1 Tax=Pelagerythrobacter marensis TaxID=543877 RepID=A0A0G3X9W1_9SPHN|nr:hypothetical protein [Pelagerythrobacter marensis]AKM07133.1 hypothetical protein AM2010_1058 [Pelagerythrobacter marensis]